MFHRTDPRPPVLNVMIWWSQKRSCVNTGMFRGQRTRLWELEPHPCINPCGGLMIRVDCGCSLFLSLCLLAAKSWVSFHHHTLPPWWSAWPLAHSSESGGQGLNLSNHDPKWPFPPLVLPVRYFDPSDEKPTSRLIKPPPPCFPTLHCRPRHGPAVNMERHVCTKHKPRSLCRSQWWLPNKSSRNFQ